jgi:hypothetical protein
MIIHGEQIKVKDKRTNRNPATLLSTPPIIVPKSKPHVIQKLLEELPSKVEELVFVVDTLLLLLMLEIKEVVVCAISVMLFFKIV